MSTRSRFALAASDAGLQVQENQAEWKGSPESCWDEHVESRAARTNVQDGCDVYWIEATCGNQTFWKIGMSRDAEKRMRVFAETFPIASWKLLRKCRVARHLAAKCEADMIVACRHLLIDGEWIRAVD